jgi:hypothetical protein
MLMRTDLSRWILAAIAATAMAPVAAELRAIPSGNGLQLTTSEVDPWPRLQGRVVGPLGTTPAAPGWRSDERGLGLNTGSALLGDLYFSRSFLGPNVQGGFRASSGLVLGQRGQGSVAAGALGMVNASSSTATPGSADVGGGAPYLGLGYSGLSAKGGWGFTADLGIVALQPGASVRLGNPTAGTQTLEDTLRELRLSPLLRLGVSYEF